MEAGTERDASLRARARAGWHGARRLRRRPGHQGARRRRRSSSGESFNVLGDFVRIWYVQNTGAAFSLLPGAIWLFVPVTVLALVMVGYFFRSFRDRGPWIHIVLGAILGGTLGNLTDRLRLGYVVDFVSVGIGDVRFPTFNVADSAVVVGIGLLVAYLTFADGPATARTSRQRDRVADRTVEGPAPAGRVDLAVASVAGISRAHAQRLIGDGRALGGRRAAPLERPARRWRADQRRAQRAAGRDASSPESIPLVVAYEDDDDAASSTSPPGSSSIRRPGTRPAPSSTRFWVVRAIAASRSARSPASADPGSSIGSTRRRAA